MRVDSFIIVQILGFVTLAIFVLSLQQRGKEGFLLWQTAGTLLFVAQYILSNQVTGAVTFSIVAVRGLVFYLYKKKGMKPSLIVLVMFMSVLAVSAVFTWQNLFSVIPLAATLVKTWSTWQDDMKWVRRTSLLSQAVMILYNLTAAMYSGALTEACNLVSTCIAVWRFDIRRGDTP